MSAGPQLGDDGGLVFGPVPSRRLGRSLGVNHVPHKVCSYSCAYCQVGRTTALTVERRAFHPVHEIVAQVAERLERARAAGESVDHVTLVPDGEPTLDAGLGAIIDGLAGLGVPVAIITNGSLLWREDVLSDLAGAAWVSVKVDTVDPPVWRRLNRPARALSLDRVLDGVRAFAGRFDGTLATETLLVRGVNDGLAGVRRLSDFLADIRPAIAYLSVPSRPPAEPWVDGPSADRLTAAHEVLSERLPRVELLTDDHSTAFSSLGDVGRDLVATCAVHPMESAAVEALLARRGAPRAVLDDLVGKGLLCEARWRDRVYYVAGWQRRPG